MSLLCIWRPPFDLRPQVHRLAEGLTVSEIVAAIPGLPEDFAERGWVLLNNTPVPRDAWGAVRPKASTPRGPVTVTLHCPPLGGGRDGGGKQVLGLLASIGLSIASGGIATAGWAAIGIRGGTLAARALAFGVSLAGALLIGALSPPPTPGRRRGDSNQRDTAASVEGNVLAANAAIPRVLGERKVFPPLAAEPLVTYDRDDEIVEAVYVLSGPHRLSDVRIGSAAIADVPGVDYELREGWPGEPRLTTVKRQARSDDVQAELRGHMVSDSDGRQLDLSGGDIALALPQRQIVSTRERPDKLLLQLVFPQGLNKNASETARMRVPLRLRMRAAGATTWINLPELHVQAATVRQTRLTIELEWRDDATADPQASASDGFVEARRSCPAQAVAPDGGGWTADAYFGTTGDAWLSASNIGASGVLHCELGRYVARILLDRATFSAARYEVEITRGAAFTASAWSASAYTVSGSVWDLFGYRDSTLQIVQSRDGVYDSLYLARSVSVWDEHPLPVPGFASIALRARNRQLEAVSCTAGGYVPDWDGTAWADWAVTSNPAPHLRDIYRGMLTARPVPAAIIDDDEMVAFRTHCTTMGYEVNHLSEDESVLDAARIVAACGYAQPRASDTWGVVTDRDRSAETPVQIFTPRNSSGFRWSRALPNLPDGFRVNWIDAAADYHQRQTIVARPGFPGIPVVTEQITVEGLLTEAEVVARARYDLAVGERRETVYSLTAPAEALVARRGDLVGVTHDALTEWMGAARLIDWEAGPGGVTALILDAEVEIANFGDVKSVPDMKLVKDVKMLGVSTSAVVRGANGVLSAVKIVGDPGRRNRIELATPLPESELFPGALVAVGLTGQETLRLVLVDAVPGDDMVVEMTFVDEASEIFA